jgi:AbrB family looped-hinge helix DNA binding protein
MVAEVANVSSEGQVTIPAEFLAELGLGEGDPVVFERHDGYVIIRRATVVEQTYGALAKYGKTPPPTIEELKEAFAQAVAEENASYE